MNKDVTALDNKEAMQTSLVSQQQKWHSAIFKTKLSLNIMEVFIYKQLKFLDVKSFSYGLP